MTIWDTSKCLTLGIVQREVTRSKTYSGMVTFGSGYGWTSIYGEGKGWHRTQESALKRAMVLRAKKLRSLKSQITRLKALKFDAAGIA